MNDIDVQFKTINHSDMFDMPEWQPESQWYANVPLTRYLIKKMRPQRVVELGVHYGMSYFCMNQAAKDSDISCSFFGVDSWQGDAHSGKYSEQVYKIVSERNLLLYAGQSKLLRMEFDAALREFEDKSIDVLHIDGYHTYSAVKNDYSSWLPKVKDGGVVMMHDIGVRNSDFGVYRLWDEIVASSRTLSLDVWPGLGLVFIGEDSLSGACALYEEMRLNNTMDILYKAGEVMAERRKCYSRVERLEREMRAIKMKTWYRLCRRLFGS